MSKSNFNSLVPKKKKNFITLWLNIKNKQKKKFQNCSEKNSPTTLNFLGLLRTHYVAPPMQNEVILTEHSALKAPTLSCKMMVV